MALVDIKQTICFVTQENIVVVLLPDKLRGNLTQIDLYFGVTRVRTNHWMLTEDRLDVCDYGLAFVLITQTIFAVVKDDVRNQLCCSLHSCILVDFRCLHRGIGLDIRYDDSSCILVTNRAMFFVSHHNINSINSFVGVHRSFEQQVDVFVLDLLELPLCWCRVVFVFFF